MQRNVISLVSDSDLLASLAVGALGAVGLFEPGSDEAADPLALDDLNRLHERYRLLMETVHDVIAFVRVDGTILEISESAREALGFAPAEMVGRNAVEMIHPDDRARARSTLQGAAGAPGEVQALEIRFPGRDGRYRTFEVTGRRPLECKESDVVIIISREVSRSGRIEWDDRQGDHFDDLTGLPDRKCFHDRLEAHLERPCGDSPEATPERPSALLYLDLDGFAAVNERLGYAAGDELLRQVAQRLKDHVREHDLVARVGGDEFAILLHDVTPRSFRPGAVARRVLRALRQELEVCGSRVRLEASVGLAVGVPGETTARYLFRAVDVAMVRAKQWRGSRFELFDPVGDRVDLHRLQLEEGFRAAVAAGTLGLRFVAVHDLETGAIVGAEACPVWAGPEGRLIEGESLVALAEETGQTVEFGRSLIDRVCQTVAGWKSRGLELRFVGVDVVASQLRAEPFRRAVLEGLEAAGMRPAELVLELAEREAGEIGAELVRIPSLGLHLALDGFGIGYSCLSVLHRLPVDRLKISRSLIAGLVDDPRLRVILESALRLASALGTEALALGVETREQADRLLELGCRLGQGSLFSEPVNAEGLFTRASEWRPVDPELEAGADAAPESEVA